jgi:hypothetical protein
MLDAMDKKKSRAFDPTYRATKTYVQIWEEAGRPNNGLKMMAEAELSGDLARQLGFSEAEAQAASKRARAESAFRRFLWRALQPLTG